MQLTYPSILNHLCRVWRISGLKNKWTKTRKAFSYNTWWRWPIRLAASPCAATSPAPTSWAPGASTPASTSCRRSPWRRSSTPITVILSHSHIGGLAFVTTELGIVQLFDRVLHVLVPQVLHRTRAVLEDVGEADVARLPHVVLQVLPTAGGWQPADYHTILGPEWQ